MSGQIRAIAAFQQGGCPSDLPGLPQGKQPSATVALCLHQQGRWRKSGEQWQWWLQFLRLSLLRRVQTLTQQT